MLWRGVTRLIPLIVLYKLVRRTGRQYDNMNCKNVNPNTHVISRKSQTRTPQTFWTYSAIEGRQNEPTDGWNSTIKLFHLFKPLPQCIRAVHKDMVDRLTALFQSCAQSHN